MDDLKLYDPTERSLRKLIRTTENFSNDIKMKFGMDKCCIQNIRNGRIDQREQEGNGNRVDEQMHIMGPNDVYKYLGYEQNRRTEHTKIKQNLRETIQKRVRKISETKLNSRNLTKAINTFVVPLLTYSFGVMKWTATEVDDIKRQIRKILVDTRKLHPKSAIERQYSKKTRRSKNS